MPTERLRVEFTEAAVEERWTVVGFREAVILGEEGDAERLMVPENKPKALAVILDAAVEPLAIVMFVGLDRSAKVGG